MPAAASLLLRSPIFVSTDLYISYFHAIHWPCFVSFLLRSPIFLSTDIYISYFHAIHWPCFVSFLLRSPIFLSTDVYILYFQAIHWPCFVSFLLRSPIFLSTDVYILYFQAIHWPCSTGTSSMGAQKRYRISTSHSQASEYVTSTSVSSSKDQGSKLSFFSREPNCVFKSYLKVYI